MPELLKRDQHRKTKRGGQCPPPSTSLPNSNLNPNPSPNPTPNLNPNQTYKCDNQNKNFRKRVTSLESLFI